jgi:oligopeptide/dipeptide ABC transporter ATP-binding protein
LFRQFAEIEHYSGNLRYLVSPFRSAKPRTPISPPSGCRFRTRCPRADQRCSDEVPELRAVAPGQFVACHHPLI